MINTLFVLLGPTGVGKTDMATDIAEHYGCDIISCDSRQFYRDMSIGTAAPDRDQLERVKHHFIQFLNPDEYYSASRFEHDVTSLLDNLFPSRPFQVMTGGSMLYIDAVCKGIDDIPDTDPVAREKYLELYRTGGIEALRLELKLLDPLHYNRVDLHNPRRLMRALEICDTTGRPYSSFLTAVERERNFRIIRAGLYLDREQLFERINNRVDRMIAAGLEEEARSLYRYKGLNALNTVGYREMFSYFDGEVSKEKAVEMIKTNTRRYAKKQLTWWSKDKDITWFRAGDSDHLKEWLAENLAVQQSDQSL